MKLTNHANLLDPIFRAVEAQATSHSLDGADISVTELIDSPLIRHLKTNFPDVTEEGIDRLPALYGTAIHAVLEAHAGPESLTEQTVFAEIEGSKVVGHIDLIHSGALVDYKFTKAYAVKKAKKEGKLSWERQLNVYHYLLSKSDVSTEPVKELKVVALIRDHGPQHQKQGISPVEEIPVPMWDFSEVEQYIKERLEAHFGAANQIKCSTEENWGGIRCDRYCAFGKAELCPYLQAEKNQNGVLAMQQALNRLGQ